MIYCLIFKIKGLKQLRGRPYFRPIPLPKGIEITHIFVKEYPNRKFYALLTDQENNLWALSNPDYPAHDGHLREIQSRL